MNINDNFEFLNVGLPEDILRRKTWGDFEGAVRLIDKRLAGNIPEALRACLVCEREMILRLEKGGSKGAAGGLPKTATIAHCKQHAQRGHEMGNHCFLCWNRKFKPN